MCFDCSPPNKSQAKSRSRGVTPVYIVHDEAPAERDFDGFGVRGQELWDEWADKMPNPGSTAVLREACRLADRAERMHRILEHERRAWAVLSLEDMLSEVMASAAEFGVAEVSITLNVSSVVTEARSTANVLNTLINGLRSAVRQAGAEHADDEPEDAIASLARQMADRAPSAGNVVQMMQR